MPTTHLKTPPPLSTSNRWLRLCGSISIEIGAIVGLETRSSSTVSFPGPFTGSSIDLLSGSMTGLPASLLTGLPAPLAAGSSAGSDGRMGGGGAATGAFLSTN